MRKVIAFAADAAFSVGKRSLGNITKVVVNPYFV